MKNMNLIRALGNAQAEHGASNRRGIDLLDHELDAVAGGCGTFSGKCGTFSEPSKPSPSGS